MRVRLLDKFLKLESSSAIILFVAAVIAVIWANSPFAYIHQQFIDAFLFLINEGLMAIFFLLVGLELKREFRDGSLVQLSQATLSMVAAIGGMLIPAIIYICVSYTQPIALKGWATPIATDIAFAVGTLSLFGRRVPPALKLFLLALAVFDDIGAIIVIALFYSHGLSSFWLILAAVLILVLYLLYIVSVQTLWPYLLMGILLWVCLLYSGIHPTLAGVLLALAIPSNANKAKSPMHILENKLHPWVAYLIMPLFALANAGFSFQVLSFHSLTNVVLGIVLGLFIGKQAGVFGFCWLFIKCRFAKLPKHSSWAMLYGVSLLCGIGFTMSLFLGTLSFQNESIYLAEMRLGVIIGSILSGLVGVGVLAVAFALTKNSKE